MNKNKKSIVKIIIAIVILLIVLLSIFLMSRNDNKEIHQSQTTSTQDVSTINDQQQELVKQLWQENAEISSDYVGTITFASKIIDLPFVQGNDNETYYRTNWQTMEYDDQGSIYMDCNNTLDDQNILLIGHYVYPSIDPTGTAKFTPLKLLLDQENYEANNIVYLYLENEVRTYQVAYVYYCPLLQEDIDGSVIQYTPQGYNFYLTNFTQEQFDTYMDNVEKESLYDTGIAVTYDDKLLTLQTCVENHDELREIVICKQIDVTTYE